MALFSYLYTMEIKDIQALIEENKRLHAQVEKLSAENAVLEGKKIELEKEKAELENTVSSLKSMMDWFRKKLFGKMSEKNLPLDPSALEPTLFDEQLSEEEQASLDAEVKAMEEQNAKTIEVKAHKREVRKPVYSDLPVVVTDIYPDGMKDNPDYVEIGVENTDRLAIRPAQMYIDRIARHKFVLRSNLQIEDPDRQTFEIAPLPEMIIPKGMASESLLADILINKYFYHLPFYRQIQKYKELGVILSDATIDDWFAAACAKLRPLYDRLREQIMKKDYIQVDESTLPVIDNEKHRAVKGYMWAVRDAVGGSVYFHYDMGSRSGDTARRLIGGYRGAVQTDGYEVYESFEGAPGKMMIGCWAHVRRKFVEALDEDRKHASEAIVYISRLYKLETEMKEAGLDADAVKERREKEAYPVIQDFEKWMNAVANRFTPKSRMGKAIVYTYTLLPRLSRYVLDGRYNIDNNGVENAIRPLALGRKNYLFCGNHDAAVRAAIVYSLFACCKARDVEIRLWLDDTLRRLPTEKDITVLLPENWQPVTAK
ncbi:MAG: IS66 family transposase [Bacteroidales bacterium]|nr:IS66 family transposase [Bacteroidales bacterium]